jgi:hypothetical protein
MGADDPHRLRRHLKVSVLGVPPVHWLMLSSTLALRSMRASIVA